MVIMSGDRGEVQEMLDRLVKAKAGLKVNITRIRVMCNSYGAKIRVEGIYLEMVEEYTRTLVRSFPLRKKWGKK